MLGATTFLSKASLMYVCSVQITACTYLCTYVRVFMNLTYIFRYIVEFGEDFMSNNVISLFDLHFKKN